jgi:pyridoxamine 5'-phosphate oxidase
LANPNAALVMHWDHLHRQVRIEGVVQPSARRSDNTSRAGPATASWAPPARRANQSGQAALRAQRTRQPAVSGNTVVPRPAHWGGYVLWVHTVELWVEGAARLHDRARWTRTLAVAGTAVPKAGPWSATRLQP